MIGTHDSMTYLPVDPKKWWRYIFQPFSQCQSKNIYDQIKNGAQGVDLRVRWSKKYQGWIFAHGLVEYKNPITFEDGFTSQELIDWIIDEFKDLKFIRIILEENKASDVSEILFFILCSHMEEQISPYGIKLIGGNRKFDWKQIYKFKGDDKKIHQFVGSMQSLYGYLFPCLWHFFNKEKTPQDLAKSEDEILLVDFI